MAIRIEDPPIEDTRQLVQAVIRVIKQDQRALFLVPAGKGAAIVQRMRVMVSRARRKLERRGIPQTYFKIHHTIHPWTENATRHDCVVMWQSRGLRHVMMEELERML